MRIPARPWGQPADDPTPIDDVAEWYLADAIARQSDAGHVSDRSWRDLEGDGLVGAVDHCLTPLGRQRLYGALREPLDEHQRAAVDAIATRCEQSPELRGQLRQALRHHQGSGGYRLWRLLRATDLSDGLARYAPVVTALIVLMVALMPWHPFVLVALIPVAFIGIGVRMFGLQRLGTYIAPLRELAPVLRTARELDRLLDTLVVDPTARARLRVTLVPSSVPLPSLARSARVVSPRFIAANELFASLYEYLNLVLLLDVNALLLVQGTLRTHGAALERMCRTIGVLDVGYAVGSFRASRTWARPTVDHSTPTLRLTALQHPVLAHGVTNDLALDAGMGLLLTGANMSGKSTLLRALGANVLLGKALATCTATSATLPTCDVLTCIGHTDDLSRGESYFYAEASAVAALLRASHQRRALFLFDELFRGTNAAERLAAGEMTLRAIVQGAPATGTQWVAIATHDQQLSTLLADCFTDAHLSVDVSDTTLHFRYTLQPGQATTRTALVLLAQLGVDSAIIAAATERAATLEGGHAR